jgi:RNA polymerase sigma factor (sigma-70 family)
MRHDGVSSGVHVGVREEDPTRPPGVDPGLTMGVDFEAFFDLHFERVFRAVLLIAGDRIEAEDVAQEAFVKVYERWDRVALMDDPVGYLYRTALNERRGRARRALRWRRRSLFERAPDDQTSASAIARAEVMRALAALTEEQRAVVALVEYVGMEPSEAASVLGISAEAARARLHRAREAMRQELQDDA